MGDNTACFSSLILIFITKWGTNCTPFLFCVKHEGKEALKQALSWLVSASRVEAAKLLLTREIYDDSSGAVIDYALVERERVITLSQMRLCTLSCQEGVKTPSTRAFRSPLRASNDVSGE